MPIILTCRSTMAIINRNIPDDVSCTFEVDRCGWESGDEEAYQWSRIVASTGNGPDTDADYSMNQTLK